MPLGATAAVVVALAACSLGVVGEEGEDEKGLTEASAMQEA